MYVCIYIYIYVYIYICIYIYVCIYIYIHICMDRHMCTYVYTYVDVAADIAGLRRLLMKLDVLGGFRCVSHVCDISDCRT